KVIVNVVELAGFIVTQVLDEPVAAASALNIKNGAVVDVGGGTTGMSILKSGKVTFSADEPTGGRHMKLVIAGALGLPYAEAEEMKKNGQEAQVFTLVLPVAQKMASLVSGWFATQQVKNIYLVGGASSFSQFANVFSKQTGKNVIPSAEPLLVTPLGIAMNADQG
ncbi:ethanolamine utilization protein EutJ, partial [Escherichia coli]|nr:ethanolamine utilization protein EutJ [Escherichia coli]